MKPYGKELILDLHQCDETKMTRENIDTFFLELCVLIGMEQCTRYWWDDQDTPEEEKQTNPHTTGISAVQFILTSNITIHTLPLLQKVFINVFSCKDFEIHYPMSLALTYFSGTVAQYFEMKRL